MRHSYEARCRLVGMVLAGHLPAQAAVVCGMSRATAYRLLARYRDEGWSGLRDRPPVAKHAPHRLSAEAEAQIVDLRRRSGRGPRALASILGRPASTIWRVLRRYGISRAARQPRPEPHRYEYPTPGAVVHFDGKKLGCFWQVGKRVFDDGVRRNRQAGWQCVHVAVDDHSRLAVTQIRPSEGADDCVRFLDDVVARFAELGIRIERVMTDNGPGYRSRRFAAALRRHGIRHLRTRPYTPRTNGKAEAFIRILQREWAYAYVYPSSVHRARALPGWTRWYNQHRPHGSLAGRPPISRVSQAAGSYT
jgi:transposase InsO family protein